jgi:uncharacterized protein YjbJ (UPF0337 family)
MLAAGFRAALRRNDPPYSSVCLYRRFGQSAIDAARRKEITMDWNRVEGNWKQMKGKVKEQWGKLTDDDLDRIAGKRDQLEGKIQERYGMAKDNVRRDVDEWCARLH